MTDDTLTLNDAEEAPVEGATEGEEQQAESQEAAPQEGIDGLEGTVPPEINQESVNKRIAEIVGEREDARREAAEKERLIEELKAQIPKAERPVVPEIPDPYDDNFQEKIEAREEAIKKQAEYDAAQRLSEQQELEAQQDQIRQQQEAIVKTVTTYAERAKEQGVNEQDLAVAGQTVASYGVNDALAQHILGDEKGPLITMHLAKNPLQLQEIRNMHPMQAAAYLATEIKPNLGAAANVSKTPEPPESLEGGGTPPKQRGPKGATYE